MADPARWPIARLRRRRVAGPEQIRHHGSGAVASVIQARQSHPGFNRLEHKSPYADTYRDNFPSEPAGPFADTAREMLKNHVLKGEVVVPDGKYFVLGDNRDNSLDSRYFGFVGSEGLLGKPLLIYDSVESGPAGRIGPRSRHRWSRLFKVL